jgi:hypothetical protein
LLKLQQRYQISHYINEYDKSKKENRNTKILRINIFFLTLCKGGVEVWQIRNDGDFSEHGPPAQGAFLLQLRCQCLLDSTKNTVRTHTYTYTQTRTSTHASSASG